MVSQAVVPFRGRAVEGLDVRTIAELFAASGFFADSRDAAQCAVKIIAGRELGVSAMAAMTGIHIVKGRVTLGANLMAALVKRSRRYDYRVLRLDNEACAIRFFEGGNAVGESAFTKEDAIAAGLVGENWKHYPRNMYFARAMSNGAKWYCPDLFGGGPVYTPDELGAAVEGESGLPLLDAETGEVLELPELPEIPPAPPSSGRARSIAKIRGKEAELRDLGVAVAEVDLERLTADELRARAGALHQLALDLGAAGWREVAVAAIAAGADPMAEDIEPAELAVYVANWRQLLDRPHPESPVEPDDLPF